MGIFRKNDAWFIDYYVEGRRVRERIGTSKREAERALAVRRGEVLQGRLKLADRQPSPHFSEFTPRYLAYSEANKRSARRDQFLLKQLVAFFGERRLKEITPWQIEQYKAKRRAQVTPASVNRELACLKHLFSLAILWGEAEVNPVKRVKFFREDNQVERILTLEEEVRLLAAASDRLRPILVLALNTGMRLGECLGLQWEHVDEARGAIRLHKTKSGKSRSIPMNASVLAALCPLRPAADATGFLFLYRGRPLQSVREAFERARAKCQLEDVRFHDLRHTFATRLVTAGVDIVTVSKLLGHSTLTMTLRYAHPAPEDLRRAVQSLPNNETVREIGGQYHVSSGRTSRKRSAASER